MSRIEKKSKNICFYKGTQLQKHPFAPSFFGGQMGEKPFFCCGIMSIMILFLLLLYVTSLANKQQAAAKSLSEGIPQRGDGF